jgi:sugar lactone lactonase YvrE
MTKHNRIFFDRSVVKGALLIILSSIIFSGCASEKVCSTKPTFFPPPPDDPHIQWLTGISNSQDIGAKESQSKFSLVLTGKEKPDIIKKITKSYGIVAHKGKLYVAESSSQRVTIIDPVNGTLEYLKGLSNPKGVLLDPVNLAFDQEDNLYVADPGRKEIVVYDKYENYVTSFGRDIAKGSKIVSVAVYGDNLYALDLGTSRIRVLNPKTGEQITEFGYIEKPNQSLRAPGNFTIDAKGAIYTTNIGSNKVMKYDIDGNFVGSFGGTGDQYTTFAKPKGIAVDDAGRIYVVDAGTNVVQLFDDQFRLLTLFGWPGLETGSLSLPAGISVTRDDALMHYFQRYAVPGFKLENLIFVVNQFGSEFCIPRITVYGLGMMEGRKYVEPPPAPVKKPEPEKSGADKGEKK